MTKAQSPNKAKPAKRKAAPRSRLKKDDIFQLFSALAEDRPDPRTELEFVNPFTLVVAVALSAQATDVGVNKATRKLFPVADSPQKMLDLGEEGVAEYIKTIGLWRNKAKNVVALSKMILEDFDGEVPQTREDLVKLPGVGRKTANVVLNEAFGQPTIAVDTHIFRVSNRTGLAPGKTPDHVEIVIGTRNAPDVLERRTSLVDPAWAICLRRAQAQMRSLCDQGTLQIQRKDGLGPAWLSEAD